jgi:hypothetical protein
MAVVSEKSLVGQIRFALSVALRIDATGLVMSAVSVENTWQRKASGRTDDGALNILPKRAPKLMN